MLNEKDLNKVVGGTKRPEPIKCPRCGNMIEISMEHIIHSLSIVCPHCYLKLTIDPVRK